MYMSGKNKSIYTSTVHVQLQADLPILLRVFVLLLSGIYLGMDRIFFPLHSAVLNNHWHWKILRLIHETKRSLEWLKMDASHDCWIINLLTQ